MLFNSRKFQLRKLGKNSLLKDETNIFTKNYQGLTSPYVDVRDLCIKVHCKATFSTQRHMAIMKTRNKSTWVLRTFSSWAPTLMRALWKTLILLHMDCCSQLWSSSLNPTVLKELEGPQHAFT